MDNKILNIGLGMALEFGENWLQPIQDRLRIKLPKLTKSELDKYDNICRDTMEAGQDSIYKICEKGDKPTFKEWKEQFLISFPWVDERNLKSIFNQGLYYAWKDGLA